MVEVIESTGGIKTKCEHCSSVLAFGTSDVRVEYRGANYGGDTPQPCNVIDCPVCGKTTDVK